MINIEIENIKGIKYFAIDLPLENGVYAIVGGNGTGKSTILQTFAQLIRPQNALFAMKKNDYDSTSEANFTYNQYSDNWNIVNSRWNNIKYTDKSTNGERNNIKLNGMYEGSLFVGTRFHDTKQVDDLLNQNKITADDLVNADKFDNPRVRSNQMHKPCQHI